MTGAPPTPVPRITVAAPASGQGKTTVAVGLMAALTRRGLAVSPGKVGPDYIDPGYHALATGRPGRNLDPWLTSPELIVPLLLHGFQTPAPADVAVIEGVMGLFDGQMGTSGFASTAHVAAVTATPVVVVVDISHAARTVAATLHGMRTFDPLVEVVGVVLNKAGSPRHSDEVRREVEAIGLPVLGVLPRDEGVSAPSRHLGLVPAQERDDARAALDRLAEQTERFVDLDAVLQIARSAPDLVGRPWQAPAAVTASPQVVAVAGGRAFTFRYAETEEILRAAGCEPVVFDPAQDSSLPAGVAGLYLGGGFPEVHAAALSSNTRLLGDIRDAIASGLPTVAECAGLIYLSTDVDGRALVGAVPASVEMRRRLVLGYRTATTTADTLIGPAGTTVRGHEFHRTGSTPVHGRVPAWKSDGASDGFALDPAGTGTPTVHASYLHVHWAGAPQVATSFAAATRAYAAAVRRSDGPMPTQRPDLVPAPWSRSTEAMGAEGVRHEAPEDPEWAGSPTARLDHHGDAEVGNGLVDFAVNVRVARPPAWLAEVVADTTADLAAYPRIDRAREALARRHGVSPDMILPTSGGAEAFTLVARAVAGRHPLVIHPQFTEPDSALRRAGRLPAHHLLQAADGFALHPERVDDRADVVFVGNPTNPTGVVHRRAALEALRSPGRVLVVDEAFGDAVPGEPESLIGPDLEGVLVLRSLTKTWGLAGLRAGYVVGDPSLVAQLAGQQAPWSVSTPAAAAMVATSAPTAVARADADAAATATARAHLVGGLERLGLAPVPGAAPFVLVEVGAGVREELRGRGYAVRRGDTFPGLGPQWVRIAVRDEQTTDGLLDALAQCVAPRPAGIQVTA